MCTNYKLISLSMVAKIRMPQPTFSFSIEAYPLDLCPIIVAGLQDDFEWRQAVFGLVASRADGLKFARHTYNARMETVATKPSIAQHGGKINLR